MFSTGKRSQPNLHNCCCGDGDNFLFTIQDQTEKQKFYGPWGDRLAMMHGMMINPMSMTKATLLFLNSTQPTFDQLNLLLKSDKPQIHCLLDKCIDLLTNLYVKFLTPVAIKKAHDIFTVEYKLRENQKDRDSLVIGVETRVYLQEMKTCGMMSSEARTGFYITSG